MTTLYDCLRQESLAIIEAAEKLNDVEVQSYKYPRKLFKFEKN